MPEILMTYLLLGNENQSNIPISYQCFILLIHMEIKKFEHELLQSLVFEGYQTIEM